MATADAAHLTGLVLAAGSSARMGRPKQLLPLHGKPLLQAALDEALASRLDAVILVLGPRARVVRDSLELPEGDRLRVVTNEAQGSGQSASLRVGLRAASPQTRAAAVLLGDQPGVRASLIDQVAEVFRAEQPRAARPVYRLASGVSVPGHPVFLARQIWPEVEALTGDRGARDLLAAHPDWLLEVPVAGEPPGDVDTPEAYRRLRAVCGARTAESDELDSG